MPHPQSQRPIYTPDQIKAYLAYISFPSHKKLSTGSVRTEDDLDYLETLIKYQLARVPFENLELHYSTHHAISLDTDYLYHKVVERAVGRGGYCMQNNLFFGTMLRSMGFNVMPVGARVSSAVGLNSGEGLDKVTYSGFSHTVNIVTIGQKRYFCDVGFGARGPTGLIPLKEGVQGKNLGDDDKGVFNQLTREHIMDNTHTTSEQLLWIYSVRFDTKMPWLPIYCFTEIEFLPQDFQVMSFYVSQSPTSWFTQVIVCQKYLLDEEGVVVGEVTLDGTKFKERRNGEKKILCEAGSEEERVNALKQHFGITLSKPEINGIKGLVSMIK